MLLKIEEVEIVVNQQIEMWLFVLKLNCSKAGE